MVPSLPKQGPSGLLGPLATGCRVRTRAVRPRLVQRDAIVARAPYPAELRQFSQHSGIRQSISRTPLPIVPLVALWISPIWETRGTQVSGVASGRNNQGLRSGSKWMSDSNVPPSDPFPCSGPRFETREAWRVAESDEQHAFLRLWISDQPLSTMTCCRTPISITH